METLNADITAFVKDAAAQAGHPDVLVGFARVSDISNQASLPEWITSAVCAAIALKAEAIKDAQDGPTREYYEEYLACSNATEVVETSLVRYLSEKGFKASAMKDLSEDESDDLDGTSRPRRSISHRTLATHAGLGWLGKNGLVITKPYGPAILLATVYTDAPVECANEVFLSRCGRCYECISACPASAIKNVDREPVRKIEHIVDMDLCVEAAHRISLEKLGFEANVCGFCTFSCPYTQSYIRRNTTDFE